MQHVDVLIVGAGISGIGAACHLRMKCAHKTFVVLEGRDRLGGTWDLFRYPGIRSDSDMFTFGYAFKPWVEERDIATGDAILNYLEETVEEYELGGSIRYGHRVDTVSWSSETQRWHVRGHRTDDDSSFELTCRFLVTGTGYYDYEKGYLPHFEGFDSYEGVVAHPQHWPEDLDYTGKRVLVIGSGATAVTLVPSMAKTAAHVTMLQRSPTYIFSRPAADPIARRLRQWLPTKAAYRVVRAKNVLYQWGTYTLARKKPQLVRDNIRKVAKEALGDRVDVDVHFNPSYEPWDQRLCLIPDGDLYDALADERASIVTDTIARFTPAGVELASGETIEADVVVPATGLELKFLGGIEMDVDGEPVRSKDLVSYRGMMFAGVPNWMAMVGYTNASWTLRVDLSADYLCRLLRHMDRHGQTSVRPELDDPSMETEPIMARLKSGYVKRAADRIPKQGMALPWRNQDHYIRDFVSTKWGRLDGHGVLQFTQGAAARRPDRFTFGGKTAVLTGAASGIGAALARSLGERGCNLALVDVQREALEEVAKEVRSHGVTVTTHVVDMGDIAAVETFAAEVVATHPEVALLINNAGVALGGDFADASKDEFDWLMRINFHGPVALTRALLPTLQRQPDAVVANVSSVFGLIAPAGQSAYAASKFAIRGFTEALRRELAGTTVSVSTIHPGGIQTAIARNARVPAVLASAGKEEVARQRAEFEKNFITSATDAADIILEGIATRRARILVGPDAKLIQWIDRLFPVDNADVVERLSQWAKRRDLRRPRKRRAVSAPR